MREFAATFVDKKALEFVFWFTQGDMAGYDQLEVWRSTAGEGGPYSELTGSTWSGATLVGTPVPGTLVGKNLELLVGEQVLVVTFTGTDPLSLTQVAAQIDYAAAGLLSSGILDGGRSLSMTTVDVGCKARLEVTGGDAAPILGFSVAPPSNRAYGTDVRPRFVAGKSAYHFTDVWAKVGYYYKTRKRNSMTMELSEFSMPIDGQVTRAVLPSELVAGWVRLIDFQGRPVANRSILISTKNTVHALGYRDFLVDFSDQVLTTDADGYCSVLMLRGVPVVVGVAGTSLVRDVTPPTDPSVDSFNLFDPAVGSDDAFSVKVPNINIAERQEC